MTNTKNEKYIPLTQFKTPDDRQVQTHVSHPEDIIDKAEELIELVSQFKQAVSLLPIDKFIDVDADGNCSGAWSDIDAADFKDHADEFMETMRLIKQIQLTENYDSY